MHLPSWLWRKLLLPAADTLTGQTVLKHLDHYETSQFWPRERIFAERDRLIRRVVETAYGRCAFYRDLYDQHGVKPADIRGFNDLEKLPLVDKNMLRAAYPHGVTIPTSRRSHEYSTSGSTGVPFTVLVDDDTMSRSRALMLLRTMYAGWELGCPVFQTGMAVDRGAMKGLKDALLRVRYFSAFDLSTDVLDRYLDVIDSQRIRFLTGYAQSMYLLARRACATGFDHRCDGVVTWGSNLLPHFRSTIRDAFNCRTFDSYGVGEGMQVAAESVHSEGLLHQFCLHVAVEITAEAQPLPPGERGEIILTRLDAGAMPLIRYRIGDVGRMHEGDVSPGGINLPLLQAVDGRVSDIITTPNGNQLIVEFFFGIFQYAPTIEHFQVLQTARDKLEVKIVRGHGFRDEHWELVRDKILAEGDPGLHIDVEHVDEIPVEQSGKRRFVISSIAK
jgi:phenylacetate-CoA ligase